MLLEDKVFLLETLIKIVAIMLVFSAAGGFMSYIERKFIGLMQNRLGPSNVGPYGLLQFIADAIKLIFKEDIVPKRANAFIFKIAPLFVVIAAFTSFAAIPFLPEFEIFGYTVHPIIADVNVGILLVIAVGSLGVFSPLLAGLASHNKWALLGGARSVVQMLSYELVLSISILTPIMLVGSLSLLDINNHQAGSMFSWLVFQQPIAFVLFVMAAYAETNRTPFDLLEHEAELVAGFATDYSGLRWGLFFIGEYVHMFVFAFLTAIVFLGGYGEGGLYGALALIFKVTCFMFFFVWARSTFPHIRPDQLMWLCWKVLIPLAFINVLLTAFIALI